MGRVDSFGRIELYLNYLSVLLNFDSLPVSVHELNNKPNFTTNSNCYVYEWKDFILADLHVYADTELQLFE